MCHNSCEYLCKRQNGIDILIWCVCSQFSKLYHGVKRADNPPHIFATADAAYQGMVTFCKDQVLEGGYTLFEEVLFSDMPVHMDNVIIGIKQKHFLCLEL